jgi:hypothetical protein
MRAQERALAHVAGKAGGGPADPSWRVTLNFHPDRLVTQSGKAAPILEAMARDGRYRSQFETGTSNGGLFAHLGREGRRWQWESRMFAGAYDDAAPADRPKYGALNFRNRTVGGSPRFGSAHLRLAAHTLAWTTFCYPDSVFEPDLFGVAGNVTDLVAAAQAHDDDPLDDYIEAQLHGAIEFGADVEALVLDPCYRGTPTETLALALGCPVEWHAGFVLTTEVLKRNPQYRGPEFVELGLSLARDDRLDPAIIGDASRTGRYDEQALKRVWHYVARFGNDELAPPLRQ